MATKNRTKSIPLPKTGIDWSTLVLDQEEAPAAEQAPPPAPSGMMRRLLGDTTASVAQGAVQGVRMLADTAGADNPVSTGLRTVEDYIGSLKSAEAKQDQQTIASLLRDADGKGILDQVVAGAKAFGVAPLQTTAQALGTSVPTLATALIPGVGQGAVMARMAAGLGMGAAQGTGAVKSSIYDEVQQAALKAGAAPDEAARRATWAQSYSGPNAAQIALGAGLGAWAGRSGIEGALDRLVHGSTKAAPGMLARVGLGAVAEGIPEAVQGGQEKFATNTALTNDGTPTDPWSGVVAQGTMEGLAGHAMGGLAGIPKPGDVLRQDKLPERGPMTRALNAAAEAAAQMADAGAPVPPAASPAAEVGAPDAEVPPATTPVGIAQAPAQPLQPVAPPEADLTPAEAIAETPEVAAPTVPDAQAARAQREADRPPEPTGEVQDGDILNAQGKPFKNMDVAMRRLADAGGEDTHEIKRVRGGLVVRPKADAAPAPQPEPEAPAVTQEAHPQERPEAPGAAGRTFDMDGKSWRLESRNDRALVVLDDQGGKRTVAVGSKLGKKIEAAMAATGEAAPAAAAVEKGTPDGQEEEGRLLKPRAGEAANQEQGASPPPKQEAIDAVPPAPRAVTVAGERVALTPERGAEWDRVEAEFKQKFADADAQFERDKKAGQPADPDVGFRSAKERHDAAKKALGFQLSAERRRITGKLTPKEQKASDQAAARIRTGDTVETPQGTGTVTGVAFGKVRAEVDGKTVTVPHSEAKKVEPAAAGATGAPAGTAAPVEADGLRDFSANTFDSWRRQGMDRGSVNGWTVFHDNVTGGYRLARKDKQRNAAGGGYVTGRIVDRQFSTAEDAKRWANPAPAPEKATDRRKRLKAERAAPAPAEQAASGDYWSNSKLNSHEHAGRSDFKAGKPRELPSYFTEPRGANAKAWFRGYDRADKEHNEFMSAAIGGDADRAAGKAPYSDAPAPATAPTPSAAPSDGAKPAPAASANKVFTEDMAAAARARLKAKLGRLNSGLDPETMMDGITLAGYHIEKGARTFAAYARAMVEDLGDDVKPYLQSWYMAVRADPRAAGFKADMDKASAVEDLDVDEVLAAAPADSGPAAEQPQEQNASTTQGSPDERAKLPGQGPQALDEVAAKEGGGTEGVRPVGGDTASGRETGPGKGAGTDGAAVPAARSRGNRAGGVRAAATGKRRGRGTVGDGGTAPAGSGVQGDDGQGGLDLTPEAASPPNIPAKNFRITPELRLGRGGEVEKFNDNMTAVRALKQIEQENRRATPAEQGLLARYVGWGGLASAFPAPLTGEFKAAWKERGEALRELLTPSEYAAARRSTRNAHYTSEAVVSAMWSAARRLGYRGGLTLESSMGAGNFLGLAPEGIPLRFIGIEYDGLTARIATLLYPQAAVLHSGFQKVPLANGAFTLNIGNPPFGAESLRFQYKPELTGVSIHNQFFRAGLDAVRPGGLQIMVVSRFLLDAQDKASRLALARKGKLVAAIRLPDTAFKENARTEVVTDIVILQRHTKEEESRANAIVEAYLQPKQKDMAAERERWLLADQIPAWVETTQVRDPLGGEPMVVNSYFKSNPQQVLGVLERSGSMQHGADITVRLDDTKALDGMLADAVARLPDGISQVDDEVLATTEARFKMLGDALRIAVANEEPGHMKFDEDGKLSRVIDREYPDGGDVMARQTITPDSPWSESLSMDDQGRWYKLEVQTGEDGKPIKVMRGDKATNRNVYARTVYPTEADVPAGLRLGQSGYDRLAGMVGLRDLLKRQLVLETEDAPTKMMEGNRARLAAAYEDFTSKHGPVNRKANLALAMTMPDGGLIAALEVNYDPERTAEQAKRSGLPAQSERVETAPILRERVVLKHEAATTAATGADALVITLSERGRVDMDRIAELRGISPEAAAEELQAGESPLVFMDPESNDWQTADAYLSGLVRRKLVAAKAAGMGKNVGALEKVQPEAWTAENVTAQIGATWVPAADYAAFAEHLMGGKATVSFSTTTNSFSLNVSGRDAAKAEQWDADGAPAPYILTRLLNSQAVVVTYVDADKVTRVDQERTSLAILKAKEVVNEFQEWVFKDSERRARLVGIFNEKFNTRVSRQFDGQHLDLPGKVPNSVIAMRRHQKNAIWRGISSRFLLLDHVVGSGKTFTGIARAMERRRMGLARKPAIMVPNHLVEQWAADVYRLYPGAKVLAAGQKDFDPKRRRRLFGKIATGDWDIVIIPHTSFGFIGIAPETEQRFLEAEMRQAEAAIKEAWDQAKEDGQDDGRRKPFGVKEAERLAEAIQKRIDKIAAGARDRLLTFEQLGIDDLTVDEAHEYKNLYYSSRLTGVRGMGNKTGSRKAADLYNKVRVLRESGGAVTFMTGTPVSNSAVELFTMMRYLAADELAEQGLTHFDAWRTQYVEATPAFEPTESGRLKEVTRLGRTWSNMRSLMESYYQFTDAVSNDDIKKWYAEDNQGAKFPVPPVKGGERQLVKMAATPAQDAMLKQTMADFDSLPDIKDPYDRNKERLRLMDRARKLSLDIRAVDPRSNSAEKNGKLEVLSRNVKRIYDQWTDDLGTQVIFLDRSVPKAKGDDKIIKEYDELVAKRDAAAAQGDDGAFQEANDALEKFDTNEIAELRNAQAGGWNAYQQIKDNLVALGIPPNEIRFMQEATNDEQKQAMFDAVNGGKVRVLIGSTPRMGAGTNVQQRLVGLHHADVTWKPSDIEQREGRIIRQGNKLLAKYGDKFEVEILAYATERTVDAKMWDLNATKLRTINGLRNYDGAFSMDIEDEESVSMAEMAALASGNPLLLERVKLESQISTLELQEKAHRRKGWGALDAVERARATIEDNPAKIARAKERAAGFKAMVDAEVARTTGRTVTVEGQEFTALSEAFAAAKAAVEAQQDGKENARYAININGKRVTSKDAISDAIGAALGDAQPFQIEFGGTKYTQRTAAGREAAALVNPAMLTAHNGKKDVTVDLGTMYGMQVVADLAPSKWRKGFVSLDIALVNGGRTVATINSHDLDPGMQVGTPIMRDLLGGLYSTVKDGASSESTWYMESQMEAAKRDLPSLEAKLAETATWAKAGELADKRARLNDVVNQLAGNAPMPAEPEDGSTNLAQTGAPEANEVDVVFSRQRGPNRGVPMTDAKAVVAAIRAALPAAPPVHLMETLSQAPKALRDAIKAQGAEDLEAAYHAGEIYVFPRNIESIESMQFVVGHHEVRHHGIRMRLGTGDELGAAMHAMWAGNQALRKAAQAKIDAGLAGTRALAVEEALADMDPAEVAKFKGWPRLVAAIRQWLRQVAAKLRKAGMAALADSIEPKTWTDADVARFVFKAEDVSRSGVSVMRAGGTVFGSDRAPVWRSALTEQVLGAKMNAGPAQASDTAFSRPGITLDGMREAVTARNVAERFDDLTRTAESFNWWHKTVGTQFHKAKTNPLFKAVYDKAQDYLHDTSAFANDPAALAGDLLPQLKTLGDMRKRLALKKPDADNLARAVFGGTLTYTRGDSGRVVEAGPGDTAGVVFTPAELRSMFSFTDEQVALYQQFRAATDRSLDILVAADVARLLGEGLPAPLKAMISAGDTGRFKGLVTAWAAQQRDAAQQDLAAVRKRHRTEMAGLNRRQKAALEGAGGRAGTRLAVAERFDKERAELKFAQGGEKYRTEQALAKWVDLDDTIKGKYKRIGELKAQGYAPLMRFGRYTVDVLAEDGSREFFGMFETEREANAAARKFRDAAKADGLDTRVTQGVMSDEAYKQFSGMTPETLELFAEVAGVEKNAAFEQYLRLAKNNRSALKRLIKRQGVAGFSEDSPRVLAAFLTSNARAASSSLHLGELSATVEQIPKEAGDVKDEAIKLREYVQNPQEEAQAIRSLLFAQYLGGSVASAVVNMTQPLMMTFPYLSQFGGPVKAAGRMLQAVKQALGGVDPKTELGRALKLAEKEGITAPQELHQLNAEASRSMGNSPTVRRLMFAWGGFFSLAEQFNRKVSFIAAFNTAKEQKIEGAFSFAASSVDETQGVYNKANRPNWARGAVGATVFTFKQYSISYVEFLKRLPTKERTLALAILVLAAGAQGLPGADDLDDLIDTIGQHAGYDANAKLWKTRVLNDAFGEAGADFVLRGFSALPGFPLDVAGRLGLGNLIPGTGLLLKSKTDKSGDVAEAIGPAGSLVVNAFKAVPALLSGDLGKANAVAGPVALKNLGKAVEMYQTGEYRDMAGRKVVDVTAADAFIKGIGFQPAEVARDSRKVTMANQQVALARNIESEIAAAWAQAIVDKEPEKAVQARQRLSEWNRANPESRIAINPQQIRRRVREMRLAREARFIKSAPKEMRSTVREVVA